MLCTFLCLNMFYVCLCYRLIYERWCHMVCVRRRLSWRQICCCWWQRIAQKQHNGFFYSVENFFCHDDDFFFFISVEGSFFLTSVNSSCVVMCLCGPCFFQCPHFWVVWFLYFPENGRWCSSCEEQWGRPRRRASGWGRRSGAGGLVFRGRGDYSPPLTFSALPASLMADRTHKGTCPIPKCPPACPGSPPLTWPAFLAYRGSSPWLPPHSPPPPQPKSGNPTANKVVLARRRRTRLLTAAPLKGGRLMKPIAVGTNTGRKKIITMHRGTGPMGGPPPRRDKRRSETDDESLRKLSALWMVQFLNLYNDTWPHCHLAT